VVVAAGGGVGSSAVDPGVPLGPGLGVPRSPCEDSNRQHDYSDNGERSKAHAALHVSSSCLGEQRQDAVGEVDSNDL
jgi:hypothetical protein